VTGADAVGGVDADRARVRLLVQIHSNQMIHQTNSKKIVHIHSRTLNLGPFAFGVAGADAIREVDADHARVRLLVQIHSNQMIPQMNSKEGL